MGQSNSWCLLAGFILRVILAPWLLEAELCYPPSSHTCLESAQCFTLTLSHAPVHAQADECPRVGQTHTRGNGFALHPDTTPCVKKGFQARVSDMAIHYSVLVRGLLR